MGDTSAELKALGLTRAQALYERGNDAALKNNFDYAVQMYREALKLDPGNLTFRQALRGVERKRFGNEPSKVGMFAGARNQPIRMRARSARSKGKFLEALEHCEDAFANNPWDVHAAQEAADAAAQIGWTKVARWLIESVYNQAGEDVNYFRNLARIYELDKDWEHAILCWEKVRKLQPADEEAQHKIRGLSASATISRAGLEQSVGRVQAEAPEPEPTPDLEELKRTALSPEERLRKQIEEEPQRVGHYLELADLLKRTNRLDEAEKVLAAGRKAIPGENVLLEAHADVQMARLQRAIGVYTRKTREDPDDHEARAKLEQLRKTFDEFELREFRRRVEARPDDHHARYQLGLRLVRQGKHDEAIAEFQQLRNVPALKVQAHLQAGLCFEAKNLPKLAEKNYQEALKNADQDDPELLKTLRYRLGRAAEAYGDFKAAEDHYNEVAAIDYTYEDVARRLESLNRKA